ncbi:MAG: GNAT family N-acetyltransferase [Gammaproteobacteria bacterium]
MTAVMTLALLPQDSCRAAHTTRIVTDLLGVESLAPEWDALLDATPCNRAFSSATWYIAACRAGGTPLFGVARCGGSLAAVIPLLVREGGAAGFATRLADYHDLIAASGHGSLAEDLLLEVCAAAGGTLVLEHLRADSLAVMAIRALAHGERLDVRLDLEAHACPYADLSGGYQRYLGTRSRAFRKGLFRAQRKAAAAGLSAREIGPAGAPGGSLVAPFLALHRARRERGCFDREDHCAFLNEALDRLVSGRRMRAFALYDGEAIVAIDLCAVGVESLCSWNGGFLPEYADFSPGTLIFAEEIRIACGEGKREYDLLRGEEPYKASWATASRELCTARLTLRAT